MTAPPADRASVTDRATQAWGTEARAAAPADAIDGRLPTVVLEPANLASLSAMLEWANRDGLAVVPRGAGTRLARGCRLSRFDAVLSLASLVVPVEHGAGDLVATAAAGATLGQVNAQLTRSGQRLPIDPPFGDRRTIGGIVATNDGGPWRHRYGTCRDLIIGVELMLADGRRAKAGGRVVKNVAGYDLARLVCGSSGTLAVVTAATFKLAPVPPASRTVVVGASSVRALLELAHALSATALTPSAVEIEAPEPLLLVRFESTEGSAAHQASAAVAMCRTAGLNPKVLAGAEEEARWRDHGAEMWRESRTVAKISVVPSAGAGVLEVCERLATLNEVEWMVTGQAALGVFLVSLGGEVARQAAVLTGLRAEARAGRGSAWLVAADGELKALIDPWTELGSALPLMKAVKTRFDPNRTLSPGNGPDGL
jgi:glycolate oxidase FAD binding subunit